MNQEDFDKAYFKAKLAGIAALGELLLQLMKAEEHQFAMQLFQLHDQEYDKILCDDAVSKDRECEKSPYHYCFSVPLGQNIEHMDPDSIFCIWCSKIYSVDETKPEREFISDGSRIIDGTSMLARYGEDDIQFIGYKPPCA